MNGSRRMAIEIAVVRCEWKDAVVGHWERKLFLPSRRTLRWLRFRVNCLPFLEKEVVGLE